MNGMLVLYFNEKKYKYCIISNFEWTNIVIFVKVYIKTYLGSGGAK